MRISLLAPAALLLCAGALVAQTTFVTPVRSANIDGISATNYPFRSSSTQTGRYMSYMGVHDLPAAAKGKLSGIAMRREGFYTGSSYYDDPTPAVNADMEIRVSTAVTTSATMTTPLANNHGSDKTTVLKRKKVSFKSIPRIPSVPAQPFLFKFPFDSGATLAFAGNKSLAYEIETFDHDLYNSSTNTYSYIYFDYDYNSTSGRSLQTGRACYGTNTSSVLPYYSYWHNYYYSSTNVLRMYGYAYNGVSGGLSVALLAAGSLPAPIKLPGDCWLYIDPAKVFMVVPGSGLLYNGTKSTTHYIPPYILNNSTRPYLDIPWDPKFAGARFEAQTLGVDPGANSMGITLSNNNIVEVTNYSTAGLGASYGYRYQSGTTFYDYRSIDYANPTQFTFN
ncbi:MAG: hypothetical protein R3F30_08515 [Planctomycetota bacterium]